MYSAGLKGPTGGGKNELLGNLSLVGVKGVFVAVLSEQQLTLERRDGKGLKIRLAAINRTRHLKIPFLPNGLMPLGLISSALGFTVMSFPYALLPIAFGVSAISLNLYSRYPVLAIESNAGDSHLISGSESILLRLDCMIDRLLHGASIEDASIGLDNLDNEVPHFPSFTYAGGFKSKLDKQFLLPKFIQEQSMIPSKKDSQMALSQDIYSDNLVSEIPITRQNDIISTSSIDDNKPQISAYEKAWNRPSPEWYDEREIHSKEENRIDSVLSDAADHLDTFESGLGMFGPDGLFNQIPTPSSDSIHSGSQHQTLESFQNTDNIAVSSSQMIKKAHELHGQPKVDFRRLYDLPEPTEIAVRDECRTGIVQEAKAMQEIRNKEIGLPYTHESTNLEEFPALQNLANTMGGSRIPIKGQKKSNNPVSWLDKLLRPSLRLNKNFNPPDSRNTSLSSRKSIVNDRFQTSQHLRLRSDQDHQSNVSIRGIRNLNSEDPAISVLDAIVSKVSNEDANKDKSLTSPEKNLRFNQLMPTSSRSDPHPLPGIRKLG